MEADGALNLEMPVKPIGHEPRTELNEGGPGYIIVIGHLREQKS